METLSNFSSIYCFITFIMGAVFMLAILSIAAMGKVKEPRNKVKFFIVKDDTVLNKKEYVLWMGKPIKSKDNKWIYSSKSYVLAVGNVNISYFGFDPADFADMKEGEIREVFINLED